MSRGLTTARVSLPTTGVSIATSEVLAFQLAHAQARDAVHTPLHLPSLRQRILTGLPVKEVLTLRSNAADRATYLRNPGLGRTLHPDSRAQLQPGSYDLAIIIADGLSALAVERHAITMLESLLPLLQGWKLAPVTLVQQGRVAIADPIGEVLGASLSLILLGERPGLSSPDSLGAYITWRPQTGRTDADRNCISNIRDAGLPPAAAAQRIAWYLQTARQRQLTGTMLKEEDTQALP